MLVTVVPIGNSRGIRIPKSVLRQLNIEEKVEMEVHDTEILIRPITRNPREGWAEKFMKMHQDGDDKLIIDESVELEDFQWEW